MARSLVSGAVSMTSTLLRAPTFRAASATPCAALPALTVQTPRRELGGRQLTHGVVGAANLEGADRLQRLELEEDLGLAGLGRERHERRAQRGLVDVRGGLADRVDRDVSGHRSLGVKAQGSGMLEARSKILLES